ncbi:hypothetical protein SETIT_7G095000v2 [Setaria italica]|uniref:Uncharacterized protein n=2 Tax=Setaria TaxID=4554 RepID=A0A368RTT8_SETIT|nr:hypothetical protein SETIT_7G095000v2 [Setaria italica]TKW04344.1 hypothetical protein SEVIR_7G102700v2 [Setaria viridis]
MGGTRILWSEPAGSARAATLRTEMPARSYCRRRLTPAPVAARSLRRRRLLGSPVLLGPRSSWQSSHRSRRSSSSPGWGRQRAMHRTQHLLH